MQLLKSPTVRDTMSLLLSFLVIVAVSLNTGCASPQKPAQPQKTMSLSLDSVPSGADVYSYRDGDRGTLIGKTPLEIAVGTHLDYDGTNYYVWFYSPDDCVTAEKIDSSAGQEYKLYVSCMLVKEGYAPKHISNQFFTICSVQFGIDFHDRHVRLVFPLEPLGE